MLHLQVFPSLNIATKNVKLFFLLTNKNKEIINFITIENFRCDLCNYICNSLISYLCL